MRTHLVKLGVAVRRQGTVSRRWCDIDLLLLCLLVGRCVESVVTVLVGFLRTLCDGTLVISSSDVDLCCVVSVELES